MIELSVIRDLVTIFGVIGGFTYYVMNLMETRRNRRITLTTTLMQYFMTVEGSRGIADLISMEWSDLDDYHSKYDHRVNIENFTKRVAVWRLFDSIGLLYRKGLLDLETINSGSTGIIPSLWRKFKPVVEMYRRTDFHISTWENWEYLAGKLHEAYPETVPFDAGDFVGKKVTEAGTL
jgi:hypothetical protein